MTLQVRGVSNILNTPKLTEMYRKKMERKMHPVSAVIEDIVVSNNLLDSNYVSTNTKDDSASPSLLTKALNTSKANREMTGISMFDSRLSDKSKFTS